MNTKPLFTIILIFTAIFLSCFALQSQNNTDTIRIEKRGADNVYYKGTTKMNFNQAMQLTASNPVAYRLMEQANNKRAGYQICGTIGGGCLGFALGEVIVTSILGKAINKPLFLSMAGAGGVLLGIGIACGVEANKKAKEGINVYNQSIKQKTNAHLNVSFYPNGMVLKMNF
jgi:hypothetical protein